MAGKHILGTSKTHMDRVKLSNAPKTPRVHSTPAAGYTARLHEGTLL